MVIRKIFFVFIVVFTIGCSYKSNDVFFTTDTQSWQEIPHEQKSIYRYKNGEVAIYNINISAYLIQKKKNIKYGNQKEKMTDVYITYSNLGINPKCNNNDLIANVNGTIYKPSKSSSGNTNATSEFLSCWYRFGLDIEVINEFEIKFLKLSIPPVNLRKKNKVRRHSVPLS